MHDKCGLIGVVDVARGAPATHCWSCHHAFADPTARILLTYWVECEVSTSIPLAQQAPVEQQKQNVTNVGYRGAWICTGLCLL